MDRDLVCKSCQNPISQTYFFCPYCGRKLRQPPPSTSVGKQTELYLLAVFIPFLTIIPGIRYICQHDNKSKIVGTVTLLLTSISLFVNIYYLWVFYTYFKQLMNSPMTSLIIDTKTMDLLLKGLQ